MRFIPPAFFCLLFAAAPSALAHHPWEGEALTFWYQGLLSGLAHPVIGLDHLAFLAAVAVLCAVCFKSKKALTAFVPATAAGVFVRLLVEGGAETAFFETAVALTVAAAGVFVLTATGRDATGGAGKGGSAAPVFTAFAGLFHGFAYGSGIVGAEASPLVFYIIGLSAVQTVTVLAIGVIAMRLCAVFPGGSAGFSRAAGAVLFAAGGALGLMA